MDNLSGHSVEYKPRHVEVHFFEPNLTPFVQPCDAGIIRCVKARYRTLLCIRAIELDDAGEADIWKIDVLSAMKMLKAAWDEVTLETISNCWKHTGISPGEDEEWEDIYIDADAPEDDGDIYSGPEGADDAMLHLIPMSCMPDGKSFCLMQNHLQLTHLGLYLTLKSSLEVFLVMHMTFKTGKLVMMQFLKQRMIVRQHKKLLRA